MATGTVVDVVMPQMGVSVSEGTITRWAKNVGETIEADETIVEISTDKVDTEVPAPATGVVKELLAGEGETVPVNTRIAVIDTGGGGESDGEPEPATTGSDPNVAAAPPAPAPQGNGKAEVLRVSPIARRMADTAGLDLRSLAGKGSGPDGRIVKADVERALQGATPVPGTDVAPAPEPSPPAVSAPGEGDEVRELSPMLKAVARRMAESKATVPHFYVSSEIDMTRALELRAELNAALADSGEKVSVNDLIVRACAQSLMQHPQAHRSYVDGHHVYHAHVHVGIAVALDDGLIVPVLRDADTKSLRQIAVEARDLAERARAGKLRQREIEGGTFTVSNMGMLGVSAFAAIINPPESTILAVSATIQRPVVRDGAVAVGDIMSVTLSCDHRACSGADGARLLQTVKRHLEAPTLLLA